MCFWYLIILNSPFFNLIVWLSWHMVFWKFWLQIQWYNNNSEYCHRKYTWQLILFFVDYPVDIIEFDVGVLPMSCSSSAEGNYWLVLGWHRNSHAVIQHHMVDTKHTAQLSIWTILDAAWFRQITQTCNAIFETTIVYTVNSSCIHWHIWVWSK